VNHVEERLAYLEGRVEEQGHMVNGIREAMASLEARLDRRLEQFEQRMEVRFAGVDQRLDFLGSKVDRQGHILIGLLIAIVGGLAGVIAAILQH
jgi:tetrahydromethanopterin S-methyltransferase subunit G